MMVVESSSAIHKKTCLRVSDVRQELVIDVSQLTMWILVRSITRTSTRCMVSYWYVVVFDIMLSDWGNSDKDFLVSNATFACLLSVSRNVLCLLSRRHKL